MLNESPRALAEPCRIASARAGSRRVDAPSAETPHRPGSTETCLSRPPPRRLPTARSKITAAPVFPSDGLTRPHGSFCLVAAAARRTQPSAPPCARCETRNENRSRRAWARQPPDRPRLRSAHRTVRAPSAVATKPLLQGRPPSQLQVPEHGSAPSGRRRAAAPPSRRPNEEGARPCWLGSVAISAAPAAR